MSDWILDHLFGDVEVDERLKQAMESDVVEDFGVDEKLKTVMGSGDVKEEFKQTCWEHYKRAIKDMKFLVKYHDGDKVFRALKKDVMGK